MSPTDAEILLAEDNPSDAELILEVLNEVISPSRIQRVHDGVEAVDFLLGREAHAGRRTRLRLALLDIKLPRIGGLEVLRAMRADQDVRHVPAVMLTSSNIESDVTSAYLLGANAYVQKPVEFARFREVVRSLGHFWIAVNEPPPQQPTQRRHER